jgi:hypothetical protein
MGGDPQNHNKARCLGGNSHSRDFRHDKPIFVEAITGDSRLIIANVNAINGF